MAVETKSKAMRLTTLLVLLLIARYIRTQDACPGLPMCQCLYGATEVDCHNRNLTEVPSAFPPNVELIDLQENFIMRIDAHTFGSLTELVRIQLDHNEIHVIDERAFDKLEHLTDLLLNHNKLTKITRHTWSGLEALKFLDIIHNEIRTIDERAFDELEHLKSLFLDHNKLTKITRHTWSGLEALQLLTIRNNEISTIDENAFDELSNLSALYLDHNYLKTIPIIRQMPNLMELGLSHNFIENLIENVTFQNSTRNSTCCSKLQTMDISSNNISFIDDTIFREFSNADFAVLLQNNPITYGVSYCELFRQPGGIKAASLLGINDPANLKDVIGRLAGVGVNSFLIEVENLGDSTFSALLNNTNIETIRLQCRTGFIILTNTSFTGLNGLATLTIERSHMWIRFPIAITNVFNGLDNLRELNLYDNFFLRLPDALEMPTTLEKLRMNGNNIQYIGVWFENSKHMKELELGNNKISHFDQNSFLGLGQLWKLYLGVNNIAHVPTKLLHPLGNLTWLSVANNKIERIKAGTFHSQKLLRYLNMSNNSPMNFEPRSFEGLTSLKELHLERNYLGKMFENSSYSVFAGLQNLQELYLTSNNIKSLHRATFRDLKSLKLLKLNGNGIVNIDASVFVHSPNLLGLDLSDNYIVNIKDADHFPESLKWLNLSNNQLACECELLSFRDWLRDNKDSLYINFPYTCYSPEEWKGKPILSFNKTQLECMFLKWWPLSLGCLVGAVVVFTLGCILYRKRWWIKLSVYKMRRKRKARNRRNRNPRLIDNMVDQDEDGPIFDAYISCAEGDCDWVKTHLLPGIDQGVEGDGAFRLYYEPRDSNPGRSLIGNIYENLAISRKFIVVLSRQYMNAMNKFELDLATNQMYEGQIEEIIVVHIEQGLPQDMIPKHLVHTMKRNRLIEWADNDDARALMKEQLIEALLDKRVAADRNVD